MDNNYCWDCYGGPVSRWREDRRIWDEKVEYKWRVNDQSRQKVRSSTEGVYKYECRRSFVILEGTFAVSYRGWREKEQNKWRKNKKPQLYIIYTCIIIVGRTLFYSSRIKKKRTKIYFVLKVGWVLKFTVTLDVYLQRILLLYTKENYVIIIYNWY